MTDSIKDVIVEEIKDVVVPIIIAAAETQTCSFTCCGWGVSLRKVQSPKIPSLPKKEETPTKDSELGVQCVPETV